MLPGPNVGNTAIIIGRRFGGLIGALATTSGLYAVPLAVLALLCVLYARFGDLPGAAPLLDGVAAAGGGLVIGAALKTARKLQLPPAALALAAATAVAMLGGLPMPFVVIAAVPLGIAWSLRRARG